MRIGSPTSQDFTVYTNASAAESVTLGANLTGDDYIKQAKDSLARNPPNYTYAGFYLLSAMEQGKTLGDLLGSGFTNSDLFQSFAYYANGVPSSAAIGLSQALLVFSKMSAEERAGCKDTIVGQLKGLMPTTIQKDWSPEVVAGVADIYKTLALAETDASKRDIWINATLSCGDRLKALADAETDPAKKTDLMDKATDAWRGAVAALNAALGKTSGTDKAVIYAKMAVIFGGRLAKDGVAADSCGECYIYAAYCDPSMKWLTGLSDADLKMAMQAINKEKASVGDAFGVYANYALVSLYGKLSAGAQTDDLKALARAAYEELFVVDVDKKTITPKSAFQQIAKALSDNNKLQLYTGMAALLTDDAKKRAVCWENAGLLAVNSKAYDDAAKYYLKAAQAYKDAGSTIPANRCYAKVLANDPDFKLFDSLSAEDQKTLLNGCVANSQSIVKAGEPSDYLLAYNSYMAVLAACKRGSISEADKKTMKLAAYEGLLSPVPNDTRTLYAIKTSADSDAKAKFYEDAGTFYKDAGADYAVKTGTAWLLAALSYLDSENADRAKSLCLAVMDLGKADSTVLDPVLNRIQTKAQSALGDGNKTEAFEWYRVGVDLFNRVAGGAGSDEQLIKVAKFCSTMAKMAFSLGDAKDSKTQKSYDELGKLYVDQALGLWAKVSVNKRGERDFALDELHNDSAGWVQPPATSNFLGARGDIYRAYAGHCVEVGSYDKALALYIGKGSDAGAVSFYTDGNWKDELAQIYGLVGDVYKKKLAAMGATTADKDIEALRDQALEAYTKAGAERRADIGSVWALVGDAYKKKLAAMGATTKDEDVDARMKLVIAAYGKAGDGGYADWKTALGGAYEMLGKIEKAKAASASGDAKAAYSAAAADALEKAADYGVNKAQNYSAAADLKVAEYNALIATTPRLVPEIIEQWNKQIAACLNKIGDLRYKQGAKFSDKSGLKVTDDAYSAYSLALKYLCAGKKFVEDAKLPDPAFNGNYPAFPSKDAADIATKIFFCLQDVKTTSSDKTEFIDPATINMAAQKAILSAQVFLRRAADWYEANGKVYGGESDALRGLDTKPFDPSGIQVDDADFSSLSGSAYAALVLQTRLSSKIIVCDKRFSPPDYRRAYLETFLTVDPTDPKPGTKGLPPASEDDPNFDKVEIPWDSGVPPKSVKDLREFFNGGYLLHELAINHLDNKDLIGSTIVYLGHFYGKELDKYLTQGKIDFYKDLCDHWCRDLQK